MQLVETFVRNPVKVSVGVLLLCLFGIVALYSMPMQLTPEVQTPAITITTVWPGASPQEVEQEIVIEQEEQLKAVEGVTKLTSESADSLGTIIMEFKVGTNMDEALLKVNSRLQQVPEYPEDADLPVITTANSADQPIAWFILSARRPTAKEFDAFAAKYPALTEKLKPVREAHNVGLALLRMRQRSVEHPEFKELMPPDDLEVSELRRYAEDEIEARFERVAGVSQSNVFGGLEDELQVVVDPEKLAARRITLTQVRNALRGQNEDTSAGDFWEGKRRYVVRVLSEFRSPEQVERQLLAMRDGAPVYVGDVADVRLGFKKPTGLVRRFGESSIAINCIRETGANVLDVMGGLRTTMEDLNNEILYPRGLQLTQAYDETEYIYSAIDLVTENIYVGSALTMVVLMLCLHPGARSILAIPLILIPAFAATYISPWYFLVCLIAIVATGAWFARGALVIGLAIPACIIGTFLIVHVLGRSLNVISLAGLAFAVGVVVDASNIVLENIDRRINELHEDPFQAAVRGTQEVWGAVVASTLTTVAVFLPVVFVQDEAGQLFRDIALAISGSTLLGLVIAVTVIPPAAARIYRRGGRAIAANSSSPRDGHRSTNGDAHIPGDALAHDSGQPAHATGHLRGAANESGWAARLQRLGAAIMAPFSLFAHGFVEVVMAINAWIQRGMVRQLGVVVGLFALSVGLAWTFWPKVEYLPSGNRNLVFGILIPPPGYNIDKLLAMGEAVETALQPYWDIDLKDPKINELQFPAIDDMFFVAAGRMVFMGLRAVDETRAGGLVPAVQYAGHASGELSGTYVVANQTSLFEDALTGGRAIDIEITGPDLTRLVALGGQIFGQVMTHMPGAQPRPIPSLDLSSPELHVIPKLEQSADMQISSTDLGFAANALIDGAYVSDYFLDGKKIDLTVKGEDRYSQSTQDVQALPVATPMGQLVPLGALATVKLASGPEQVNHRERERAITIQVAPPLEMPLEEAMNIIESKIVGPIRESGQLEGGYRIDLAGTADKLRQAWKSLRFNLLLALAITYLLMAALFESWLHPFVIIFSVPLGAVGGILGLALLNLFVLQTLDVLTMLGFVILIGTVVANPILIIHQALNHIREDGMAPRSAVLQSTRTRIRPIFMTTITTVLGLLPLVLFPGAGSELYRGLGAVVLGGIIVSTVFTLIYVPALFILVMSARQAVGRLVGRQVASGAMAVEVAPLTHDSPAPRRPHTVRAH